MNLDKRPRYGSAQRIKVINDNAIAFNNQKLVGLKTLGDALEYIDPDYLAVYEPQDPLGLDYEIVCGHLYYSDIRKAGEVIRAHWDIPLYCLDYLYIYED